MLRVKVFIRAWNSLSKTEEGYASYLESSLLDVPFEVKGASCVGTPRIWLFPE